MPPRILIVDDDEALLRLIASTFESEGWHVITANSGLLALRQLEDSPVDALVLDLRMPEMDGTATYREIRRRGHLVPTLILSAYGAETARAELGAEAALGKPFDLDRLIEAVYRLIRPVTADPQA